MADLYDGNGPSILDWTGVDAVMDTGTHHPLACRLCRKSDGKPAGSWVVKPQDVVSCSDSGSVQGVMNELGGAELCVWVGIPTPQVGLLRFPEKVPEGLWPHLPERDEELESLFKINAGSLAFCCKRLEGATDLEADISRERHLRAELIETGLRLFALDGFLRHSDRSRANPNALWWRNQLVAIDHGNAFGGLRCPGVTGKDAAGVTVWPTQQIRDHVLFPFLRKHRKKLDFRPFVHSVKGITDEMVRTVVGRWPSELDCTMSGGQLRFRKELMDFITARRDKIDDVVDGLVRVLNAEH